MNPRYIAQLRQVIDPELGVNVYDLGMIYELTESGAGNLDVKMTLTTPGCPLHNSMMLGVKHALEHLPEVKAVQVELVWNPPWSPEKMTDEGKEMLGMMR